MHPAPQPLKTASAPILSSAETNCDSHSQACTFSTLIARVFSNLLVQLGWAHSYDAAKPSELASDTELLQDNDCLLKRLLVARAGELHLGCELTEGGVHALRTLVAGGYCLRTSWPGVDLALQREWLGTRFFLTHQRFVSPGASQLVAIVSSRVGRYGRQMPSWPYVVDQLLRWIARRGQQLVLVDQTAVATLVEPLTHYLPFPSLRVKLDRALEQAPPRMGEQAEVLVAKWLCVELVAAVNRLEGAGARADGALSLMAEGVRVSPELESASEDLRGLPIQDRLAMCLPTELHVLSVRTGGTIDALLERRLRDSRFALSSVYLTIHGEQLCEAERRQKKKSGEGFVTQWLDRGVVGWYLPPPRGTRSFLSCSRCSLKPRNELSVESEPANEPKQAVSQLTWQYRAMRLNATPVFATSIMGTKIERRTQSFLVHCVRGNSGPLPDESRPEFVERVWMEGTLSSEHPLETLGCILRDGKLRASSLITRTESRCVSLSAVPLDDLLARRSFQSHLGRWDWEPYGLLIDLSAVHSLGGQPVIYGDESTFDKLDEPSRPFFQPARRRLARKELDHWEHEREWRVCGDVDLKRLPRDAVILFVEHAFQARQLAWQSRWPVIYMHADPAVDARVITAT